MPLQKQFVPVTLTGMDTKTDEKNLATGQLTLAQNMVVQKTKKWQNRSGYERVGSYTYANARALSYDGSGINVIDGNVMWTVGTSGNSSSGGDNNIYSFDSYYPVSPGGYCQFVGSKNNFVTFASNGAIVNVYTGGKLTYVSSSFDFSTYYPYITYSICTDENGLCYHVSSDAATINVFSSSAKTSKSTGITGATYARCAAAYVGGKSYVLIVYAKSGNTYGFIWNKTDDTTVSEFLIKSTHSSGFERGCCLAMCSDGYWHVASPNSSIQWSLYKVDTSGTVTNASPATQNTVSVAFTIPNLVIAVMTYSGAVWYSCANVVASRYSSYIGTRVDDRIICSKPSSNTNQAIMLSSANCHATAAITTSNTAYETQWLYALGFQVVGFNFGYRQLYSISQVYFTSTDIGLFISGDNVGVLNLTTTSLPTVCSYGGENYTNAGGSVTLIESSTNQLALAGYSSCPSSIYSVVAGGTGSLTAGDYKFFLTWQYTDAQGKQYFSPASIIASGTSAGSDQLTVTVYQWESAKFPAERHDLILGSTDLVLWATENGGNTYYSQGNFTYTGSGADTMVISSIDTAIPYPFQGGIIESGGLPPCGAVSTCLQRIWAPLALGIDTWMFSTTASPNFGPRFPEEFRLRTSSAHGRPQIACELDNKILLFHEYAVYVTWGDGPDETASGSFAPPILVTQSVGCKHPRSVIQTDKGVMFMSHEGIWLITKGMELQYIGKDVEAYNALTITGAFNLVDRHQAWFYSQEGTTLCWDDFHGVWSIFTGQDTNAVAMVGAVPHFVKISSSRILKENQALFADDGTSYTCKLTSGWISLAGVQGFERMYRFSVAGAATDSCTMTLYRDFSGSFETFTIPAAYSSQWEVKPSIQKGENMKFDLTWANITGAVEVSAFGIEAGVKGGAFRLPMTNRIQGN